MWLKRGFGADAIVSVWTAFEGLKGKQAALSKYGWKGLLIKDMLNIRPFSVHYIGCQTGKRRGGFLVIDHLSPPLVAAGSYKDISDLRQDISLYKRTLEGLLKEKYRKKIIKKCETLNINKALGTELDEIKTDSETFAEFLHQLESYLREMEREYMPYGLHVLGEVPQGAALVSMVESMLGKEYKDHIVKINLSQGLAERLLTEVIVKKLNVKVAQNKILGQVSEDITKDLNLAIAYANRINQCKIEIPRILAALDGRYIPPGPSGDIIRRPEVLPTGRNPYAFDDRIIPTKEAWDIGRQQAEQLIEKHRNKYNVYPEKIGFVLWISETNRHHGVMESEILYLLGVKPVWNRFERVGDVELISATQLKRPRIDVVVTTSGSYRDGLSSKIKLIDKAVRLAAQAEKEKYENYIKVHSEENYKWLKENTNYRDSEAKDLSMARVFSHEIGRFNSGVGEMITAGNTWKNENQVADRYIGTMGFVYGGKLWGKQSKGIFKRNLRGMKIGVFSTSSVVVGVGDQGVPHYLGALGLAAKSVSGESADLYITNLRNSENTKTETLHRFFNRELRSRYFNPKWIEGMIKHGYAGARNMEEFSEKLWHWDVTTNELVTEDMWNEVNDIYVNDKYDLKLQEYFDKNNPYALQSMISTMLEAREKGYWHPTKEVLEKLVKVYAELIARHGVACSYGTCAEPSLHKDVSNLLSAMSDVKPELIKNYQENVDKATVELEEVKGYEMKEVKEKKEEKLSTTKVVLGATLIILLIMLVVGRGLWKGMRRQQ